MTRADDIVAWAERVLRESSGPQPRDRLDQRKLARIQERDRAARQAKLDQLTAVRWPESAKRASSAARLQRRAT